MLGWIFGGLTRKIKRAIREGSKDVGKDAVKKLGNILDDQSNKWDYLIKTRIKQLKFASDEAIDKATFDFQSLLDDADDKIKIVLKEVNIARQEAIQDIGKTIDTTNVYLENRINQFSFVVMSALKEAGDIASDFTPNEINEKLVEPTLIKIDSLEDKLFQDANQLIDKIDEAIDGKLELIRNEFRKHLAHVLPNPLDPCRQKLNLSWTPGVRMSDIELYELTECYELSKLNERASVDEILKIYGQLQQNAAMMAALVKKAPELKKRAIEDWLKYGVLCEFWRTTIKTYEYVDLEVLEPQKIPEILISQKCEQNT